MRHPFHRTLVSAAVLALFGGCGTTTSLDEPRKDAEGRDEDARPTTPSGEDAAPTPDSDVPRHDASGFDPDAAGPEPDALPSPPLDARPIEADGPPPPPPPAATTGETCALSADCPAGQHCELGVCVQTCHVNAPCDAGRQCSPRGRCEDPGESPVDTPVVSDHLGTVSLGVDRVTLSALTDAFTLDLDNSVAVPVRYRIEPVDPWIVPDEETGMLAGRTTLRFTLGAVPEGGAVSGVRVVTEAGDVFAEIRVLAGLGGVYAGSMTYGGDDGPSLGAGAVEFAITERNGALAVSASPEGSLVFPGEAVGGEVRPVTGTGAFIAGDGLLDFTLVHTISPDFGGDRNPFRRPIQRRVRFLLRLGDTPGQLSGTFHESVDGLLPTTLVASGRVVALHIAGREVPEVDPASLPPPPPPPPAPNAGAYARPSDVFPWRGEFAGAADACRTVISDACELSVPGNAVADCRLRPGAHAEALFAALSAPLEHSFSGVVNANGYTALADACAASLDLARRSEFREGVPAFGCGMPAVLACLLPVIQDRQGDPVADARLYARTISRFVTPALLVAKEAVVRGLRAGFVEGTAAERRAYEGALDRLRPTAVWLSQAAVLESLRASPAAGAAGDPVVDVDTFLGMRALGEVAATVGALESEVARIEAATGAADGDTVVRRTQETAVVSLMQSLAVGAMVAAWRADDPEIEVPETAIARFIGVLGPLDRAMSAALQGANVFGVPRGFVPFVYRPDGGAPTNFEQMLDIAASAVEAHGIGESAWLEAVRTFDQNEESTRRELQDLRIAFDDRLRAICGAAFDPNRPDWNACGTGQTGGHVGERLLAIREAQAQIRAHQARLQGQMRRVELAQATAARILGVRQDNFRFQLESGVAVNVLSSVQRGIHALVVFLDIASNAQVWNGGAPIGMGVGAAALEAVIGGLEDVKDALRLAQTARSMAADIAVEQAYLMQEIKNEWINFQMMSVETAELAIRLLQTKMAARNLIDEAMVLYSERQQALAELGRSVLRDPIFRLTRDRRAVELLRSRADAQRELSLAARALQYEIDLSVAGIDGAVMNAGSSDRMRALLLCLENIHHQDLEVFAAPMAYETRVSVRRQLGIVGPRVDAVTGRALTEGEQFRSLVLRGRNTAPDGTLNIEFGTSLAEGNDLWTSDVCRDRIASVQAELVGDFLGDDDAQVNVTVEGTGVLADCAQDALTAWDFGSGAAARGVAVIQAGVNGVGRAPPNGSLFGQPVARATWRIAVPSARRAPANADVDLTHLDDIVLVVRHAALPKRAAAFNRNLACLSAGQ
jgi:hypothetical protein